MSECEACENADHIHSCRIEGHDCGAPGAGFCEETVERTVNRDHAQELHAELARLKEELAEKDRRLDRERLASLIHDEWVSWASSILRTEHRISQERRARWAVLIVTPYAELSEAQKDYDRKWADKVRALEGTPKEVRE